MFKCVFLVSVDLLLGVLSTHFLTFRATFFLRSIATSNMFFLLLQRQIVAANKNISLNAEYIHFEYVSFNLWQQTKISD